MEDEVVGPRSELLWAAVDFDGTLTESVWTPEDPVATPGPPKLSSLVKVRDLHLAGYKIVVHTARPWADYEIIEQWLVRHRVPFKGIVCGKLLAAVYIDDRAIHVDDNWLLQANYIAPLKGNTDG